MLRILIALSFFFSIYTLQAINHYAAGDTLYVWAEGGLIVRDTNAIAGKRLSVVPYGAQLVVLESSFQQYFPDSIVFLERWIGADGQKFKGCYLKGRWVRVKFQGVYGFVFDGYLSHFPAPQNEAPQYYEPLPDYLTRIFGVTDRKSQSGDQYIVRDVYYGQGISYKNIGTKEAYEKFVFPNLSVQELLIFIKNSRMASEKDRPMLIQVSQTRDAQTFKFRYYQNGDGYLYLHVVGNTVVLETRSSC